MKNLMVGFILIGFSLTHAAEFSARVAVSSEQEIVQLHKLGLSLYDAKIRERIDETGAIRYRVFYMPENGFVTVSASQETMHQLRESGFRISDIRRAESVARKSKPNRTVAVIPYQFGWPRLIYNGLSLYENSPTIADMDGDGNLDVSVTNAWGSYSPPNPPYVIVWKLNGTYLPGFPVPLQPGQVQSSADAGISAMGDIFGDEKLEIVCGDENGFLYAFNYDGTSLNGFPKNFGTWTGVFTPALADIDRDGKKDIAVISHDWNSPYGNAFLHLFKVTSNGPVEFPGYPIDLQRGASNSPAIGDLNGDGRLEVVVATGGAADSTVLAKINVYSDSGHVISGFPWVIGKNSAGNSPTLYDLDGDGTLEILIRVKPDNNINGIYAIDHNGAIVEEFPFPITYGNSSSCVAVGDMDGDNVPELAYGGVQAVDSGKVWVYDLSGSLLPGFPSKVFRTWVDGSVAIADIDGDGLGDVVCGTNGTVSKPGLICAFNHLGQMLPDFPLSPGNPILNSFETHPTLTDIDKDGDTEIFAGRVDQYVYGWDTQGVFDSLMSWTTFKGNAARTGGQLRSPYLVSIKNETADNFPAMFELMQNYPNPFNPKTNIKFRISNFSLVSLRLYDVLGNEIAALLNGKKQAGEYEIEFDAGRLPSGIYLYRLTVGSFSQTRKMILLK
jgi:hypothetical protein